MQRNRCASSRQVEDFKGYAWGWVDVGCKNRELEIFGDISLEVFPRKSLFNIVLVCESLLSTNCMHSRALCVVLRVQCCYCQGLQGASCLMGTVTQTRKAAWTWVHLLSTKSSPVPTLGNSGTKLWPWPHLWFPTFLCILTPSVLHIGSSQYLLWSVPLFPVDYLLACVLCVCVWGGCFGHTMLHSSVQLSGLTTHYITLCSQL